MKKIGILTLSASNNCGSLLQTYALRKLLCEKTDTEVIHFSSEKSHDMYDIFPKRVRKKGWEIVKRLRYIGELWREKHSYEVFRKKYIGMNLNREFLADDMEQLSDKYEAIIVGSDQVWNVCMGDFDPAFFAGWAKCKKIAYAPSLGGYDLRESKEYEGYVRQIQSFEMLSVREQLGKNCLEELTGRDVELVLDPTLLLQKKDWEELVGEPIIKGEYYFYYSWAYCYESLNRIVYEDAKNNQIPVYVMDAHKWLHRRTILNKWEFILCKQAGPLAFLNLMYYAKKCYVESFHGLIFAYIFQKNFWILNLTDNLQKDDIRLFELSNLLNAQNRVIFDGNVKEKDLNEAVIYGKNNALEELRDCSKEYIKTMFEVISCNLHI